MQFGGLFLPIVLIGAVLLIGLGIKRLSDIDENESGSHRLSYPANIIDDRGSYPGFSEVEG